MAKQSGIHQLRGKVGEHSYYRQTGIIPGLVRSINPAMSARVKSAPEYANTRLNNQEFRNAAELASAMGSIIRPKYRPMILPFSQSKLTSEYLRLIKETSGAWGQRTVVYEQQDLIAQTLNELAKVRFSNNFIDISDITVAKVGDPGNVEVGWNPDQATQLASLGVDGVVMKISAVRLVVGSYNPTTGANNPTFAQIGETVQFEAGVSAGSEESSVESLNFGNGNVPGAAGMLYCIVIAMPYREINTVRHTLQEYCTYKCVSVRYAS